MSGPAYRIRIRNADDTGDALIVSSLSGDDNPYLQSAPHGDGQSINPLTGEVEIGAYVYAVIDAVTDTDTRVVTSQLADANGRQQLLSRRAYGESSTDGGSNWDVDVAGFVTRVQLTTALVVEITVGESRRVEQNTDVFRSATPTFGGVTNLIGPTITGGWGPIADSPRWRFKVTDLATDYVELTFVSGVMRDVVPTLFDGLQAVDRLVTGQLTQAAWNRANDLAQQYFESNGSYLGDRALGTFPGLQARVNKISYALDDEYDAGVRYTPMATDWNAGSATPNTLFPRLISPGGSQRVRLIWDSNRPSVDDLVYLDIYATAISEQNPLHIAMHPVDIWTGQATEAGIAYDATAAATVKAALGGVSVLYRMTAPEKLGAFWVRALYGPFGFAHRINDDGEYELVQTRLRNTGTPTDTLDGTNAVEVPSALDLDESSIANRLVWKQQAFTLYDPNAGGERPADDVVSRELRFEGEVPTSEQTSYGIREIVYEIPGAVIPELTGQLITFYTAYVIPVADEIADRFGRGCDTAEVRVLPSITARQADFVTVTLARKPGAAIGDSPVSQRGTSRIAQVIRRTAEPGRVSRLLLWDAGAATVASVVPTFTIAKSADDPLHLGVVTLTNASDLTTAGLTVRVEMGTGASEPSGGTAVGILDPATDSPFTLPPVGAGLKVWARMRGEAPGIAPSAWSSWQGVQLDGIPAVTSLANSAGADDTERVLTWTVGSADYQVKVLWKLTADNAYTHSVILPAGSNTYTILGLEPSGAYTADVVHIEAGGFNGQSADVTTTWTNGSSTPTLDPPINPAVFAGTPVAGGGAVIDGSYGLEVTATEFPSSVVVEVAVETSVGSGTFGSYAVLGSAVAVAGGRTRVTAYAPNDGLLRSLRAYQSAPGYTDSTTTTPLSVNPWGITAPPVVDTAGEFVLMASDTNLPNGRTLTAGTGISITDGGAGSTVTIASTGGARGTVVLTTASTAADATDTGTVALGKSGLAMKAVASANCRVRLYKTSAARTADSSRAVGADPDLLDGVVCDLRFTDATGLTFDLQTFPYANGDASPSADLYYAVLNESGATAVITVTFTRLVLES